MASLMGSKPPETRGQYALEAVRRALSDGSLVPGEHLSADDLAARLQVSHIPIREALRFLEAQGLLRRDDRGRVFVPVLSREEVEEIYDLRDVLESEANRAAVPRLTDGDIAEMEAHAETMSEALAADDYARYAAANREFHFVPLRRAGGAWRLRFLELLWDSAARYQSAFMQRGADLAAVESQHVHLLAAYRARDVEDVDRSMRDHRQMTIRSTSRWLDHLPAQPGAVRR